MEDPSGGFLRWWPQDTLDDIARLVDPLLNFGVLIIPYVFVLAFLGSIPVGLMWMRMQKVKGPHFTDNEERALRTVPLSFGLWGWFGVHVLLMTSPRMTQAIASNDVARDILEILMMAFAFFVMFGLLNLMVRHATSKAIRRKFNLLDIAIVGQLLGALGVGLFAWATVRHASIWTVTVVWQHFLDSWTFSQGSEPAIYGMPTMAKLHVIAGSLALATLMQSRVLTLLAIPRPSLWRLDQLFGKPGGEDVGAGRAIALMYGISAEDKHGKHKAGRH
jgi:nitrate reductase gamma subunit